MNTKPTVMLVEHQKVITTKLMKLLGDTFEYIPVTSESGLVGAVTDNFPDVIVFAGSMVRLDGETKGPNSGEARFMNALPASAWQRAIVLGDPLNLSYAEGKAKYVVAKDPFDPEAEARFVQMVRDIASHRER